MRRKKGAQLFLNREGRAKRAGEGVGKKN